MIIYELVANLFIFGLSLIFTVIGLLALFGLIKALYDTLKD